MANTQVPRINRGYKVDLTGKKFGRLSVLHFHGVIGRRRLWACRCVCKKYTVVEAGRLKSGRAKSCGCLAQEMSAVRLRIHGETTHNTQTAEYRCWRLVKARCYGIRNNMYKNYGARGVVMCDRWKSGEDEFDGYQCFLLDMGRKPSLKHSIDRIDVNGNYEPGNCRWATPMEQGANMRRNVYLEFAGLRLHLAEWGRRTGIKSGVISIRMNQLKWSVEEALTTPLYGKRT